MDPKEYRIGNLLRDKASKTLLEVIELTKEDIVTHVIDRNMFPLNNGWGLEPIPITSEWLINFGFIYSESQNRYLLKVRKECWICWSKREGYTLQNVNSIILEFKKLKYVHQIQNLHYSINYEELKLKQS